MKCIAASIVILASALVICVYYMFSIKSEALPVFGVLLALIGLPVFIRESGLVDMARSIIFKKVPKR
jgi:hypothetical protein